MVRYFIITCLLLASALQAVAPARAAVGSEFLVALKTKSGWSREQRVQVVFVTGLELSRVSTKLPVEFHHIYAIIMHENSLPTVARVDAALPGVQREFTTRDLARLYALYSEPLATQIAGEGRDLKWRLRPRDVRGWVEDAVALHTGDAK